MVPIIFDGASTNVKVAKKLLKLLNENEEGKFVSAAELKLQTSFKHGGQTYFVVFCIIHIIKTHKILCSKKEMIFIVPNWL